MADLDDYSGFMSQMKADMKEAGQDEALSKIYSKHYWESSKELQGIWDEVYSPGAAWRKRIEAEQEDGAVDKNSAQQDGKPSRGRE